MKMPSQIRFTPENEPSELLQYMLIMFQISKNRDFMELSRFMKLTSTIMGPEDFNLLLRSVVRMMGSSKCGPELCSDWLMTNLYELYKAFGA
jgi:hypothetical protein